MMQVEYRRVRKLTLSELFISADFATKFGEY